MVREIGLAFKNNVRFRQKWNQEVKQFLAFLDTVKLNQKFEKRANDRIGILLTPWLGLPVPWYAVAIGMLLRSKGNDNISFIVNDLWNRTNNVYPYCEIQQASIIKILKKCVKNRYKMDVILLSNMDDMELNDHDQKIIEKYANINAIRCCWNSVNDAEHDEMLERWRTTYRGMYGKMKSCSEQKWKKIIIPGGMFQETGLFMDIFKDKGIDVLTYDSGPGRYKIGINVCASKNGNTYKTAQEILSRRCKKDEIKSMAWEILSNRMQMRPEIGVVNGGRVVQSVAYQETTCETYDIVMFCNMEFDTAALGTHDVFRNDYEWIVETIRFVLENTDATIAVRQHPLIKLFPKIQTNEASLKKLFKGNNRVTFIGYDEKISSYNIIEAAKAIIVNTSTVGLEVGMLGKFVITESHSYYHQASFVRYGSDREQYYSEIIKALDGQRALNEEERYEACVYYFLTQKCSSVISDFTPQPNDFQSWTKRTFIELLEDENIAYMLKAIIDLEAVDRQVCANLLSKQ